MSNVPFCNKLSQKLIYVSQDLVTRLNYKELLEKWIYYHHTIIHVVQTLVAYIT